MDVLARVHFSGLDWDLYDLVLQMLTSSEITLFNDFFLNFKRLTINRGEQSKACEDGGEGRDEDNGSLRAIIVPALAC